MIRTLFLRNVAGLLFFETVVAFQPVAAQTPNTWMQKANLGAGNERLFAVGFSINGKGYIGTGSSPSGSKNDFWEYDPVTDTWMQKANFGGTSRGGAVGFSIGSKGYVGTGSDVSGAKKDFWEYDQSTNTWTQRMQLSGNPRQSAIGFSINGKGYIGGGRVLNGSVLAPGADLWEYDPTTDTWTQKNNMGCGTRYGAASFSLGDRGYIGAGWMQSGVVMKDFWQYNPANDTWMKKADFMGTPREGAIGFGIGNKCYIGMGYDSDDTKDLYEYDTTANTWTQKYSLSGSPQGVSFSFCNWEQGLCSGRPMVLARYHSQRYVDVHTAFFESYKVSTEPR